MGESRIVNVAGDEELVLDGVEDVCEVKGMHQTIIYGDHAKKLRSFCQLYGIDVID